MLYCDTQWLRDDFFLLFWILGDQEPCLLPRPLSQQPLAQCCVNSRCWIYTCCYELGELQRFPLLGCSEYLFLESSKCSGLNGTGLKESAEETWQPSLQGRGVCVSVVMAQIHQRPAPAPWTSLAQCTPAGFQLPWCLKTLPQASEGHCAYAQNAGHDRQAVCNLYLWERPSTRLMGLAYKYPNCLLCGQEYSENVPCSFSGPFSMDVPSSHPQW